MILLDDVVVFPELEEGTVAFTTDTTVAVDAFMEGAIVTTPTVVVIRLEADEWWEVVTAARAAIAPEAFTVVPEVLGVAPEVVDLMTGATTAVTTVAVVREVPEPKLPMELVEPDVVLPTAATTDVDVVRVTAESDKVDEEAKDLDNSRCSVVAETDCETLRAATEDGEVTEDDDILSTPVVLAPVDMGLVTDTLSTVEVLVLVDTGLVIP